MGRVRLRICRKWIANKNQKHEMQKPLIMNEEQESEKAYQNVKLS